MLRVKSPGMLGWIVLGLRSLRAGKWALCMLGHLCKACIGVIE